MDIFKSKKHISVIWRFNSFFILFLIALTLFFGCGNETKSSSSRLKKGDKVKVTIIQSSDLQNRVTGTAPSVTFKTPHDLTRGGFSRLATKIKVIRKEKASENTPVLLFDTGDALSGTLYDIIAESGKTAPSLAFFKTMKYDAITLGANDFLFGLKVLPEIITNSLGENRPGEGVPLLLTTFLSDGLDNTADDKIDELKTDNTLLESLLITLDNGLVVGVLSIMGNDAYTSASGAIKPASFVTDTSSIQSSVNSLRYNDPDIVVALMHGVVKNRECPSEDENCKNYYGGGWDIAESIYGVDVFLAGGGETLTGLIINDQTQQAIEAVAGPVSGQVQSYDTSILSDDSLVINPVLISSGKHGEYLAQLDIEFEAGRGITKATLEAHDIDSSVTPDSPVDNLIGLIDDELAMLLADKNMPEKNTIAGSASETLSLKESGSAVEHSLGNLVADSFRYAFKAEIDAGTDPLPPTTGFVGNGMIRSGLLSGTDISFSDIFTILPLGDSLDTNQLKRPGYPVVRAYLSGEEIVNLCQFSAYTIGAQDTEFLHILSQRTAAFLNYGGRISISTDYINWRDRLNNIRNNGDDYRDINGAIVSSADYYTTTYASDAYVALVEGIADPLNPSGDINLYCDCDDLNDPGYNLSAPESCPCEDANWKAAAKIYQDGATFLSSLSSLLSGLTPDNYVNLSGIRYSHMDKESLYKVRIENVKFFENTDYSCSGTANIDVVADKEYPFTTDLFTLLLLTDTATRYSLERIDTEIRPQSKNGVFAFEGTINQPQFRFDLSPDPDYPNTVHEELKCWRILYDFIKNELNGSISDSDYGTGANRVTIIP